MVLLHNGLESGRGLSASDVDAHTKKTAHARKCTEKEVGLVCSVS